MPSGTTSWPMPSPSITAILWVGPLGMADSAPADGGGSSVLAQTGQDANPFALAAGTWRWVLWRGGGLPLQHQMLLQKQLLLKLLRLLKLLPLLFQLELLVLLQVAQMILRRFLLRQDGPRSLQVLRPQMIELGEERLLASILLRPQRLTFLLQSMRCRRLLHQAQVYLRVGGLRRNAQQNDEEQPLNHGAPMRWTRPYNSGAAGRRYQAAHPALTARARCRNTR